MNKKLIKLAFISTLSITAVGTGVSLLENSNISLASATSLTTWGHYSKVDATFDKPGCKEFWISCDSHKVVFTKPEGTIVDRGFPSDESIESWKELDDGRIIPTLNSLTFGRYPQSQVKDEKIIKQLEDYSKGISTGGGLKPWISFNYWYQNNNNEPSFGFYLDVDLDSDGEFDYRGVYFSSYRPYENGFSGSERYSQETFQYDYGYYKNTTYWFNYEPLEWKILSKSNDDLFLMTTKIVDDVQYSYFDSDNLITTKTDYQGNTADVCPNNYKYSDLRNFLNTDLYQTAFNSNEKDSIKVTNVDNSDSTTEYQDNINACENTDDKLFVLSYKDVINPEYGFDNNPNPSATREMPLTDYSKCVGGIEYWATRTPSGGRNYRVVNTYGGYGNNYDDANTLVGVAPAMHVNR